MELLYSNILPMRLKEDQRTIADVFHELAEQSDQVKIAVGYVSKASLLELDELVERHQIKHILLIIGMYYIEGMPEGSYHTAIKVNRKWLKKGVGEIRIVRPFKYHGKLYAFYKEGPVGCCESIVSITDINAFKLKSGLGTIWTSISLIRRRLT